MRIFNLLVWMWIAASLAFIGDGLSARAKRRWVREAGNVLFAVSFAMLVIAIVAIAHMGRV